jgi:hypothetical protein
MSTIKLTLVTEHEAATAFAWTAAITCAQKGVYEAGMFARSHVVHNAPHGEDFSNMLLVKEDDIAVGVVMLQTEGEGETVCYLSGRLKNVDTTSFAKVIRKNSSVSGEVKFEFLNAAQ